MTAHTLQRPGYQDLRRVAYFGLLGLGVLILLGSVVAALSGVHPWWGLWLIGVLASLGAALLSGSGMAVYILRRLIWAAIVVNVVVFITFLVFFKLPNGDPALRFVGKFPTTENIALARERLHLDKPFYVEYFYFIKNFAVGDENGWPGLGYSYGNYISVRTEVLQRAPRTLWL